EAKDQPIVESLLFEMGFCQQSKNNAAYYLTHHHSMPFYHAPTGVWVEVHRGIFPQASKLSALPVFSRENIEAESILCRVEGMAVKWLTPELQIVYTASHWALGLIDLKQRGGLFALLDTIFILRGAQQCLRWNVVFDWVEDSVAATHLYLLLSYLHCKKIVRHHQLKNRASVNNTVLGRRERPPRPWKALDFVGKPFAGPTTGPEFGQFF